MKKTIPCSPSNTARSSNSSTVSKGGAEFLQVKYAYIEKRDWINFFDEGIDGFAIGVDEKYCMY